MRLLVTGGCGFIGSRLAFEALAAGWDVTVLDNLRRRGSELHADDLRRQGVEVRHGDVRLRSDWDALEDAEVIVMAAAEPTVMAGVHSSPEYTVGANLIGTLHGLEKARQWGAAVLLLSTSRVYDIDRLRALPLIETASRFRWGDTETVGVDPALGISESFPTEGFRSIYGTTKLASELMVREYHHNYGIPTLINRCGLIAGPGQMARSDQGVISLWVARHVFGQPLRYIGFDGSGRQVRDVLHVADLCALLLEQLRGRDRWRDEVYNVGGGPERSTSLAELTALCRRVVGREVPISGEPTTSRVDLPIYLTDQTKLLQEVQWAPTRGLEDTVRDLHRWIVEGDSRLHAILGKG